MNKILFSLAILFFLIGCESDDKPESKNILNSNTHIIDTTAIKNCSTNTLSIYRSKVNFNPEIGDILLASPSQKDSLGILVRITNVNPIGDSFDCITEPSNLNSAFRQLFIDGEFGPLYNNSVSYRSSDGGSSLGVNFTHNQTIATGLDINGNLNLNFPNTRIKYIKKDGSSLPEEVLVAQDFNTNGSYLEIRGNILQSNEFSLHSFNLPMIYVPVAVGPIIVIIPFTQNVDLKVLPASISGDMYYKVFPIISATVGICYKDGAWQNLSTFSVNTSANTLQKSDFSDEVTASITIFNPTYEISPMGLDRFKLYAELPNKIDLEIKQSSPNYSLKYNLEIESGVKAEFWTGIEITHSLNLPLYTKTIMEGDFCYEVGDTAFGGIVFYVDPNNCSHGYVCSSFDISTSELSAFNQHCIGGGAGILNTNIGSGFSNTNYLASYPYFPAAALARSYIGGNFTDWSLPSKDELNKIFEVKDIIGNIEGTYWSSSYANDCNVWAQNFNDGTQNNYYPNGTQFKVRAIRRF